MRILLISTDPGATDRIARRILAEPGHEIETAAGLAQAARRDLGRVEVAVAWHAQLQELDPALLRDFSLVSRRLPIVAALSRAVWAARRPSLAFVDGWLFLDDERTPPSAVLRLARTGYWVLPDFVVRERGGDSRDADPLARLTALQRQVLQELRGGYSNREMALRLMLSEQKVKKTVHEIIAILGLSNRTQAAVFALSQKTPGSRAPADDG